MVVSTPPTAADLRAEIARRQLTLYRVAARVGCHPGRLGMMLRERVPLPPALAEKVLRAVTHGDADGSSS